MRIYRHTSDSYLTPYFQRTFGQKMIKYDIGKFLGFLATLFGKLIIFLLIISSCKTNYQKNEDHLSYMSSIRETATRMLDNGDSAKALTYFDSAYQVVEHPGIGDIISRYSFKGDNYYRKTGELEKAIECIDSVFITLSNDQLKKKYVKEYITALFVKGDLLFDYGEYNEAYQSYYQGKIIAQTILDQCAISDYAYRLGMVSYKQGKYQEAAFNFKQCLEDSKECEQEFRRFAMGQELLSNISLSYSKLNQLDSAILYSNRALDYIETKGVDYPERKNYLDMARGVIYGNQADLYYKSGDSVTAEKLLLKSIEINSRKGFENRDAQLTMLKLGDLYINTHNLPKASRLIQKLKLSLDTIQNLKVDIGLSKLNWYYFDKIRKEDSAYLYLQKYMLLKDSLDVVNEKLIAADLDKEFQSIEQKNKYLILSRENELRQTWLYIAVLFSFMAVVILFLLWKNWNASKRNIAVLTGLNKQIIFQNEQLEQTLKDLKKSSIDKDRILKVVAHDLRNPIGAIANISSILLDEIEFSALHRQMVELVKESSWQSIEMINELLTADSSDKPAELKLEWVDMSDLIFKCIDQLRFRAEAKRQQITIQINYGLKIMADREKLGRVVGNLVMNAIKFSPFDTAIVVKVEQNDGLLELTIQDNGIGIPLNLRDHVFEMSGTSKRQGTSGEQPFGIGLAFSKQIVEAHGGKIWFESEIGAGTTFYIQLPVDQQMLWEDKTTALHVSDQ